ILHLEALMSTRLGGLGHDHRVEGHLGAAPAVEDVLVQRLVVRLVPLAACREQQHHSHGERDAAHNASASSSRTVPSYSEPPRMSRAASPCPACLCAHSARSSGSRTAAVPITTAVAPLASQASICSEVRMPPATWTVRLLDPTSASMTARLSPLDRAASRST